MALTPAEPVSSGEIRKIDPVRVDEVDRRHQRLAEWLAEQNLDAVLLSDPANLAWLTAGADLREGVHHQPIASLFVTADARVVLCQNTDSGYIFDRKIAGLGFQLKERPWQEPRQVLLDDVCRGRNVGTDVRNGGSPMIGEELAELRRELVEFDIDRIRTLGKAVAHAVEATARTCERGQTEAEIAGQLAHRLVKHEISPERLQVMADGQGHRYRHWSYGTDQVERFVIISAVGTRNGLHVGCSRTASFGRPPEAIMRTHEVAVLVQATGMFFSQPNWTMGDIFSRIERIYEKFDAAEEWRLAEQASVIGYKPVEEAFKPHSEFQLRQSQAVHWHPSVRSAATGDTILLREQGFECLTPMQFWPELTVRVKGVEVDTPDILVREASNEWAL